VVFCINIIYSWTSQVWWISLASFRLDPPSQLLTPPHYTSPAQLAVEKHPLYCTCYELHAGNCWLFQIYLHFPVIFAYSCNTCIFPMVFAFFHRYLHIRVIFAYFQREIFQETWQVAATVYTIELLTSLFVIQSRSMHGRSFLLRIFCAVNNSKCLG